MSTEENKAVARRFIEAGDRLGAGEDIQAIADEIIAPDFVAHLPGGLDLGFDTFLHFAGAFAEGFPPYIHIIEEQIAEGDLVVTRMTWRGTHAGPFQGMPPTGTTATMAAINIVRIVGGKIVEQWVQLDTMALMQQLGGIPEPAEAGSRS